MSRSDDLDAHLEALVRLKLTGAEGVYGRALEAARNAVAKVIFAEAERLAGVSRPSREGNAGNVVAFHRRTRDPNIS